MKIGVFGTGSVGQAIAGKLEELEHEVVIGTRDPAATLAKNEKDQMGNPPFKEWHAGHSKVRLATFREAAQHGELLVNCTSGHASLDALKSAGMEAMQGKVLV